MKDRITLGRAGDVRDLTADIGADPYATERIFAALDYERDRRREKNRVDAARRASQPSLKHASFSFATASATQASETSLVSVATAKTTV